MSTMATRPWASGECLRGARRCALLWAHSGSSQLCSQAWSWILRAALAVGRGLVQSSTAASQGLARLPVPRRPTPQRSRLQRRNPRRGPAAHHQPRHAAHERAARAPAVWVSAAGSGGWAAPGAPGAAATSPHARPSCASCVCCAGRGQGICLPALPPACLPSPAWPPTSGCWPAPCLPAYWPPGRLLAHLPADGRAARLPGHPQAAAGQPQVRCGRRGARIQG